MECECASVPECAHTHTHTHISAGGNKEKGKAHRPRSRISRVSALAVVPTWFPLGKSLNLFKSQLLYCKNGNSQRVIILAVKSIYIHNHLASLIF